MADTVDTSLWPVSEIAFGGLFGDRGLALPLDPDLTVLTGENGSGKSTLLKAIHLVSEELWHELFPLPLAWLRLVFSSGERLEIRWEDAGLTVDGPVEPWHFDAELASGIEPDVLKSLRDRRGEPGFDRIRLSGMWHAELRYGHLDPEQLASVISPQWLGELLARFHTKHISARRLEHKLRPDPSGVEGGRVPVVQEFADQLKDLMKTRLSAYASDSRRQEQRLPTRIVEAMQQIPTEDPEVLAQEVDQLRAEVRSRAESLARVGLFEGEDPDYLPEYPRDNPLILLAVREVYRVTAQRLQELTGLRHNLELFSDFLNERFSNKHVELNQQVGIGVALADGERIQPRELSSGEQQLLALAYELLFDTEPEAIVLLDEPELSLHVAWLQGLLNAFCDMGQSRRLQFLIATHSPVILRGHQERERSLDLRPV
ncbi:MAG TPA: AAA family ATPase [Solirubrobacterales bacterium]|nr:AAA family ATPase [Solirubrobacterales bacterium]